MLNDYYKKILQEEFANFPNEKPKDFAGGCRKSRDIVGVCVHLRTNGTIGAYDLDADNDCEHYRQCRGYKNKPIKVHNLGKKAKTA